MSKFNPSCVCGGSIENPNADCERCLMQAEIERLELEVDAVEKKFEHAFIDLNLEIDRLKESHQDICTKYCEWYDNGEWYTSASDAAYGLVSLARLALQNQEAAKADE